MSQRNSVYPIVLSDVDTTGIAGDTWTPFVAAGLSEACFFLRITNAAQTTIYISFDSDEEHLLISAGETLDIDFQTNSLPGVHVPRLRRGTVISVRGEPVVGNVYLAGYYNRATNY